MRKPQDLADDFYKLKEVGNVEVAYKGREGLKKYFENKGVVVTITMEEAAEKLGMSVSRVYDYIKDGKIEKTERGKVTLESVIALKKEREAKREASVQEAVERIEAQAPKELLIDAQTMADALKAAYQQGRAEGLKEGIEQGRQEAFSGVRKIELKEVLDEILPKIAQTEVEYD